MIIPMKFREETGWLTDDHFRRWAGDNLYKFIDRHPFISLPSGRVVPLDEALELKRQYEQKFWKPAFGQAQVVW